MFGGVRGMEAATLANTAQIATRLVEVDSAVASLRIERLELLSQLRARHESEGKSERQTAITVAQYSRSSARIASAEIRFARKVAALPIVQMLFVLERFRSRNLRMWQ
jgi:hypothetical protein